MIKRYTFVISISLSLLLALAPASFAAGISTGAAPPQAAEGTVIQSLSGSVVVFDSSVGGDTCYDGSGTYCFKADSYTNDYGWVYYLWLKFPSDWTVTNAYVQGTPSCDSGGTWGAFSWSLYNSNPNEILIDHDRYMSPTDHCVAYYCVEATQDVSCEANVSWFWDGDDYGGTPHWPCSSDGYTPEGATACDESVNPPALVPICGSGGLSLTPGGVELEGCSDPETIQFTLKNCTGSAGTFDLGYWITSGAAYIDGPDTISLAADESSTFDVALTPDPCSTGTITAEVGASGNGASDDSPIFYTYVTGTWSQIATEPANGSMDNVLAAWDGKVWAVTGYGQTNVHSYDPAGDSWTVVGTPVPFVNYARSGCQYGSKVYIYGDAGGVYTGLWSYDMATGTWAQETPSGTPPAQAGIWAPAWVADEATGYCYMTGGATAPGAGNLATVYVYDPAANAWLAPLPNFTSIRDFHAAWIFNRPADSHKLLCVGGGNNGAGMTNTQCYDFTAAAWNAEDADLGALPTDWWGMGYGQLPGGSGQLWLTAGIFNGGLTSQTYYYDVAGGSWVDGGVLPTTPVYRTSAVVLDGTLYHVGGSTGSFTYTGLSDKLNVCPDCAPLIFFDNFSDGGPLGDPQWAEILGDWKVSATKRFLSKLTRNNLATVGPIDPAANPLIFGRINTLVKMTARFIRFPNASIIFAYQDPLHYRYVRIKPGKLFIGQAGNFGGELGGVKRKVSYAFRIRRWYNLRLDLLTDGTVNVYDGAHLVGGYTFPGGVVPGGVGVAAKKTKSFFDNYSVYNSTLVP